MLNITEIEDHALKMISSDVNMAVPWYILFSYEDERYSLNVSEKVMHDLRSILSKNYDVIEHRYKDCIDNIDMSLKEFPRYTKEYVNSLMHTYSIESKDEKVAIQTNL